MNSEFLNRTNYSINDDENICDSKGASSSFEIIVTFSYLTIMVISLFGNGIVCYLVQCTPKFRSVTNLFISNLSVGDILMTLLCVPFSFISVLILKYWPFGGELCRAVSYFQAVSVFVSAYTLVAISLDRYIAIMHPFRPRMTKSHAKFIIGFIWFVALMTALPTGVVSDLRQPNDTVYSDCGWYICMEVWDSPHQRSVYSVVLLVLQYAVPFVALVFTYARIAVVVWGKQMPGEAENLRDQRMADRKRKMIKMMVTVVIVFTMCWLPYNVLLIVLENNEEVHKWAGIRHLYFACHWLAMSHTCYNPAIYVYMNHRYRDGFISVLSKVPCIKNHLPPIHYEVRGASLAMTGFDHDHDSSLRRVNTYISSRKNGTPKSSMFRKPLEI